MAWELKHRCAVAGKFAYQAPGEAYRLYTEDAFDKMSTFTVPEMRRSPMTSAVVFLHWFPLCL